MYLNNSYDPVWHVDTGATNHATDDVSNLQTQMKYNGTDQMMVGNDQEVTSSKDEDPQNDFCVADTKAAAAAFSNSLPCLDPKTVTAQQFKTSALGVAGNTANPFGLAANLASAASFPALNTLGLSFIRFDYAPGGGAPLHLHPRASEVLFVVEGQITAGFTDTSNKHYSVALKAGDLFVIPKGLVHYVYNTGSYPAWAMGAFNSQNPGTTIVSLNVFAATPGIPNELLAKSFLTDAWLVKKLKRGLGGS